MGWEVIIMTKDIATIKTSVFSEEEVAKIQSIFSNKNLSDKNLGKVKIILQDCLIAMAEYRHICFTMKGSEFVAKGGVQINKIKEGEAKLKSFGIIAEGNFRMLTLLLVQKSEIYTFHAIENAIKGVISV